MAKPDMRPIPDEVWGLREDCVSIAEPEILMPRDEGALREQHPDLKIEVKSPMTVEVETEDGRKFRIKMKLYGELERIHER